MAISDHDRRVLQELEDELRTESHRLSSALGRRRAAGFFAAAGVALGLLVIFIGLRLADTVGTFVGVGGALIFLASAWLGVHDVIQRRSLRLMSGPAGPNR